MTAYDGRTKADIIRGLLGDVDAKCKCLREIANLGQSAGSYFRCGPEVTRCLKDPSHDVKCAALRALASMGPAGASDVQAVAAFLKDCDVEIKCCALGALGGFGSLSEPYEQEISCFLTDQLAELRAAAACALGKMNSKSQATALRACFQDPDPNVVSSALIGVGHFGELGALFAADVGACLSQSDPSIRLSALEALTKFGEGSARQASKVVGCLGDDDGLVREAAVAYFECVPLGMLAFKLVDQVSLLLTSSDGKAQAAAAVALGRLQANHDILMKRLKSQSGDIPSKARPLDIDTNKLIALLSSHFEDESSLVLATACVQPKLPVELRRPACAAATTLALLRCANAMEPIVSQITPSSPKEVNASFLKALGMLGDLPDIICAKITPFLNESSAIVRAGACLALGGAMNASQTVADLVASKMKDTHPAVRGAAAIGISRMKTQGSKYSPAIGNLLDDVIPSVKISAMQALRNLGERGEIFAPKICKLAIDGEVSVRTTACGILSDMGARGFSCKEEIATLLQDPDTSVRLAASEAIAKMERDTKPPAVIESMQALPSHINSHSHALGLSDHE